MKNYTITVNGVSYDVVVEEKILTSTPGAPVKAPVKVPSAAPATTATQKTASSGGKGSIEVKAGAAGKVFQIVSAVGQNVEPGDPIVVIEAMKMEIPVVAPEAGVVASIDVTVGDAIEAGDVLATLN